MIKMPNFRNYDDLTRKLPYGWDYSLKLEGRDDRKRYRPTFKTKREKATYYTDFQKKWFGDRDSLITFDKTLYHEYVAFDKRLKDLGITKYDLMRHYEKYEPKLTTVTISQACNEILEISERKKVRSRQHIKLHLEKFIKFIGDPETPIEMITREDVQNWVYELEKAYEYTTVKNYVNHLGRVFNREKEIKESITRSPIRSIEFLKPRGEQEPCTMDVGNVKKLLYWCEANDPSLGGLLALGFFSGLRSSVIGPEDEKQREDGQLTPQMLKFKRLAIEIPGKIMKKGKRLFNETIISSDLRHGWDELPPSIWPWLKMIKPKDFKLTKSQFGVRRKNACNAAGVEMENNVARHSFGTYYSILMGSNAKAAQIMAVETTSIFLKNYQGVRSYNEAEEYFNIYPQSANKN